MGEFVAVRFERELWTCICEGRKLEAVGFIDLMSAIAKELGVRKFSVVLDCEGRAVDGAQVTFDLGAADTYIPD